MFTEESLRDQPAVVKTFMGLSADQFWELVQQMHEGLAAYTAQQHARPDRQRAVGAGRPPDLALSIRTAVVLTYLRLHVPQKTVAALFVGVTQSDVSRDLRRLLPLIQTCLPCPLLWEEVRAEQEVPASTQLCAPD